MLLEALLRLFSRKPDAPSLVPVGGNDLKPGVHALSQLREVFPGFDGLVRGKRVLDFGCGIGQQAVALARECGAKGAGVDRNLDYIDRARRLAGATPVEFVAKIPPDWYGAFDVVLSHNSMEHFADPEGVLAEMLRLVKPGGRMLIVFGAPWFSPYGAHQHFWCHLPWVHLVFPERTVLKVRQRYCSDKPTRYETCGLNRMSIAKFERLTAEHDVDRHYTCVKGQNWIGKIPVVRELFINRVAAVIRVPAPR
jgi:SAM-dependent methyltransferase